ncbi:PepSY-associated TM helix domain-containing protein [Achromobacter aegrifaciens]|jgi:uncharacterized iron-regulated membrane protein|uniref:PepSY-associated TM helix domain-containing protein n=2 Tax=Burkholderiales TaxID=80840 RepID=A0ABU2DLT2_ACHAE|nr:PepSY-associated TM helix domain-containing protein [Achromobacter aegrifaciens]MDR7949074.1 PepSY-associated TM helix domain-containing protein [Achromobacter aegrifaciens]
MKVASRSIGSPSGSTSSDASPRKWFFVIHGWAGLKLSVLMAFICLTGTLAVISTELDWLVHSEMRVEPASSLASWGKMAGAAQAAHPDWTLLSFTAPYASRFAARALMRTPQGEQRFVWVDPYLAVVTGDTSWFNIQRWLRNTHRHLFLPTQWGVPLVSALSLLLIALVVTGLVIYKRWWRGFLAWPRWGKRRLAWADVHRLVAVWSLWFTLLIAVTGLWYLIESLGGHAPPLPALSSKEPRSASAPLHPSEIDAAVDEAQRAWPGLTIRVLRLEAGGRAVQLEGQTDAWLVRDRANAIRISLPSGASTRRSADELDVHQRISELADPLHFGAFGPWPVRAIWFLFGSMLTALSVTGAYLYGLRIAGASAKIRAKAGHDGPPALPLREAWAGMRRWRWVAVILLVMSQGLFLGEAMGWLHLF